MTLHRPYSTRLVFKQTTLRAYRLRCIYRAYRAKCPTAPASEAFGVARAAL